MSSDPRIPQPAAGRREGGNLSAVIEEYPYYI